MSTPPPAAARPQPRINRYLAVWLSSPLGFLSGNTVLVRYTGRSTGLRRQLPVNLFRIGREYAISVGRFESKTWWRNFTTPRPIELVRGRRIRATGVAVAGTTDRGREIAAEYFATHRGAAVRAGLPRLRKGERAAPEQLEAAAAKMMFIVLTPKGRGAEPAS